MMIDGILYPLTVLTMLGCGMMAGAYAVFSAMLLPGLARLPSAQGIAAMQSINVAAISPIFMLMLFAPALASGALIVASLLRWGEPFAGYLLAGGVLYLGTIVLTAAYHVPRNNALATVEPHAAEAERAWTRYLAEWVPWNYGRAVLALAATVALTLALNL